MVPPPPAPARAPSRRHRRWAIPLFVLGAIAPVATLVVAVTPAGWVVDKQRCAEFADDGTCARTVVEAASYAMVPSSAESVAPRVRITGADVFTSAGQILFVTVREPTITLLDWVAARNNPAARLLSRFDKFGDGSPGDQRRLGQRQMTTAKDWAVYVALSRAGLEPELVPGPAVVDYVLCLDYDDAADECTSSPPAADFLRDDDVIVEAAGVAIVSLEDLQGVTADRRPGDEIELTVERGDETLTATVELIAAPDDPERAIIGFMPIDTTTLRLPDGVTIGIDTGSIGGPSAGLAFTLSLIDVLTAGDLTGGVKVGVTGTIRVDGTVGAIGGLSSKASAVQQVGARYMLVPAGQPDTGSDSIAAAQAVVGDDVELIPVATLEEALEVLARLGGDPLIAPGELAST